MMFLLALAALAPVAPAAPRYAVFGSYRNWTLVEMTTAKSERLVLPADVKPRELNVSRDGKLVAFTAYSGDAHTFLLYAWDRSIAHPPRQIGDDRGYHANPVFDRSGTWVYFAHNPDAVGQPMNHEPRAFAQIYRVRLDGTSLTALTNEKGCHFAPEPTKSGKVVYVHSQCDGFHYAIEGANSASFALKPGVFHGQISELAMSDDRRQALYVVEAAGHASLFRWDAATLKSSLADSGPRGARLQPRFGPAHDIYYMLGDTVWHVSKKARTPIADNRAGQR